MARPRQKLPTILAQGREPSFHPNWLRHRHFSTMNTSLRFHGHLHHLPCHSKPRCRLNRFIAIVLRVAVRRRRRHSLFLNSTNTIPRMTKTRCSSSSTSTPLPTSAPSTTTPLRLAPPHLRMPQ